MNKPLIMCSIGVSILFGSMACQKEGLTSGAGTGGGLSQGGAGGVVLPTGGSPDTGGIAGTGGLVGAGGLVGTGGLVGQGGGIGTGGLVGTGGALGSGGASVAGGTISSGGARGTGGFTGAGAAVGVGGAPGLGGAPRTGGKSGAGGGLVGGSGTGGRIGTGGTSASGGAGGFSGTGGATSKMCGGIAGLTCPASQFCDMLPVGDCGKSPDAAGTCAATGPLPCAAIYLPVCGCDGKTYGNDCERQAAGVSMASQGACPACPADISQIGTWPCTEGLTCEYGTDPRPNCRPSATCTNGIWTVLQAKCTQLPPVTCPATRDAAAGQVCPTDQAYCVYGDLSCVCTNCSTGPVNVCGGSFTWHCAAPNADPACPPGIPLLGSACSTNGQACTYTCGAGGGRTCRQGAWYAANGGPCPVSTRRAKKDILYLGSADRQRVADDLARFKLATYEYRDPALAGIRHLGFIIEDVPGSPAVDGDGNMVDLYGYASMLVAAVQAQGEEIRKLKAELLRLKRQGHSK